MQKNNKSLGVTQVGHTSSQQSFCPKYFLGHLGPPTAAIWYKIASRVERLENNLDKIQKTAAFFRENVPFQDLCLLRSRALSTIN